MNGGGSYYLEKSWILLVLLTNTTTTTSNASTSTSANIKNSTNTTTVTTREKKRERERKKEKEKEKERKRQKDTSMSWCSIERSCLKSWTRLVFSLTTSNPARTCVGALVCSLHNAGIVRDINSGRCSNNVIEEEVSDVRVSDVIVLAS